MSKTVAQQLVASLRMAAQAFTPGDQVAPCAVLWADPENLWAGVISQLKADVPELYQLGPYAPAERTGPALWLRCIEGRTVEGAPAPGVTPIFHLPGIGREALRTVEDCSMEVAALAELQFRGNLWLHANGKEWTPSAFLVSKHGGLSLDLANDQATRDAVIRALPKLLEEPVESLRGRRIDADFLNGLLAPDGVGLLLRWLSNPEGFQKQQTPPEWDAFCHQTRSDLGLDVIKDGPLKAARLLAARTGPWEKVWTRFADSPSNFAGVVEWLRKAAPKELSLFDSDRATEVWPDHNDRAELALAAAMTALGDRPQAEVIERIKILESANAKRRSSPWARLGMSPWATVLEPLHRLALACETPLGAPSPDEFATAYATTGWKVDAEAIATLEASKVLDDPNPILKVVRALYLPWVETTARHLQAQLEANGARTSKRTPVIEPVSGRVVLFADGLRMDIAALLQSELESDGHATNRDWEWSTVPSVTATAKPAASPISPNVTGNESGEGFQTRLIATGQTLTHERFKTALAAAGWQILEPTETGNPEGSAWTEAGAIDKRGHNEGWKLARSLASERRDLIVRINQLIAAGWREVIVVTDHGWLLMPLGLPKVELKAFLSADRWGRCAALKPGAQPDHPTYHWHWNDQVGIACPPGAGAYRAGTEYSHGGISLQETVIPYVTVTSGTAAKDGPRITEAKWTGARCRVSVSGECAGCLLDLRTSLGDSGTSLLADKKPRELTAEGKATLFLETDADIGKRAEIVLLSSHNQVIHSLPTTLGT